MSYYPLDDSKDYETVIAEITQKMIENTHVTGEALYSILRNLMLYLRTGMEGYNDMFGFELHYIAEEQAFLYVPMLQERGFNKGECEYVVRQVGDWWESYQSVLLCTVCDAISRMKRRGLFKDKGKITELRKSYEAGKVFNESQKKYLTRINMALIDEVNTNKRTMEFAARYMFEPLEYFTANKSIEYRVDAMQNMLMEIILELAASAIGEFINIA